jgi:hypothetical protein
MNDKDKRDSLRFGLIAATVLLASLALAKAANSFMEPRWVQGLAAYASAQSVPDPNRSEPCLEEARELADALKVKNLFVKAPSKQHPVKQVDGILGREVLIANKWYKVGDQIGEARIVSIDPTRVTIEWDGKTKTFAPIAAAQSRRSAPEPPKEKSQEKKEEAAAERTAKAAMPQTEVVEEPIEDDPLAWMGVDLPPHLRAMILEKWNQASDAEKKQAQEQWSKMSDEERDRVLGEMEQRP